MVVVFCLILFPFTSTMSAQSGCVVCKVVEIAFLLGCDVSAMRWEAAQAVKLLGCFLPPLCRVHKMGPEHKTKRRTMRGKGHTAPFEPYSRGGRHRQRTSRHGDVGPTAVQPSSVACVNATSTTAAVAQGCEAKSIEELESRLLHSVVNIRQRNSALRREQGVLLERNEVLRREVAALRALLRETLPALSQ